MARSGQYRDSRDRKVIDTDGFDAVMKTAGFSPQKVARESRDIQMMNETLAQTRVVESEIVHKWAQGIADQEPDKIAQARADLKAWNETNPESPIRVNRLQIAGQVRQMMRSREQRFVKAAPKELRGQVVGELADAGRAG